jgi:predicted HTH transcriptional regulator
MTLLGQSLHQLTVEHLQSFLENAEDEPLLWEAKSGAGKKPIRKAICGFANGEQPGYLILGAVEIDGGWELPGAEFPGDDPPVWISEVIRTGLKPQPLIDVRSLKIAPGRKVAVIEIPPVAIPLCGSRHCLRAHFRRHCSSRRSGATLAPHLRGAGQQRLDNG